MSEILRKSRAMASHAYRRLVDGESDDLQNTPVEKRISVELAGCIPDRDEIIVRSCSIVYEQEPDPTDFVFKVFDSRGNSVASDTAILGMTRVDFNVHSQVPRWEIVASTRIRHDAIPIRLHVSDRRGLLADGARSLNHRRLRRMLADWRRRTMCAWDDSAYAAWARKHRSNDIELERQSRACFAYEPLISIVVPLYNTPIPFFRDMVASVKSQTYRNWELVLVNASAENEELDSELALISDNRIRVITLNENAGIVGNTNVGIEMAQGDFIAFLDHDDFLEPDALYHYVAAVNERESCDLLYCDEDSYTAGGRFIHPHFKSDFNRDLLYAHNYITHFLMVRTQVVRDVGLSPSYVEGAQDYDLTLRIVEVARDIVHVPRVLYHWRIHADSTSENADSKSYAQDAGRRALEDHFRRRGLNVDISDGVDAFTYIESYKVDGEPLVSIVIPNKDHVDVLSACLDSLLRKATYGNIEIVIVENNSADEATFAYYDEISQDDRIRVVRFEGAFNYSKVINFGVSQSSGEYVLLLNNDTEVISGDFIERMVGYFVRDEVGVVGAKLLHLDDTIQHAGVIVGPFDEPWHVFLDAPDSYRGYMGRSNLSQNYLAVTGACQMVSRAVFDEVGGYDENFAVAYNDVDFCLKVRELGKLVVYCAEARLYHREFTTRGRDVSLESRIRSYSEKARLQCRWAALFIQGDPYYNANLEKDSLFFSLGRSRL